MWPPLKWLQIPLCSGHFFGRTFYTLTMFKLLYNEHLSIMASLSSVPEVAVLIVHDKKKLLAVSLVPRLPTVMF